MRALIGPTLFLLGAAMPAGAQVIEIADDGSSRTYDGPSMFTGAATTSIGHIEAASGSGLSFIVEQEARRQGVDAGLVEALAWQESRGRMDAISPKGAIGVMQLMPATASALGVDSTDLADNVRGGVTYLRRQLERFGEVPLALAAYNAGPGAVIRYRGIPPFAETKAYVARILARWRRPATSAPVDVVEASQ